MTTYLKLSENITIKAFVIHRVNKEAGQTLVTIENASNLIATTDTEKRFLASYGKAIRSKSEPTYGLFGTEYPTFKNLVEKYLENGDFYAFTVEATQHYKSEISRKQQATGGFILYAHYSDSALSNESILVATLNNRDTQFVNEESLTLGTGKFIDLHKLDSSCILDLTKYQQSKDPNQAASITYLTFVKGNKEISEYFLLFIDTDNNTTGSLQSKRLNKAVDKYLSDMNLDSAEKIARKRMVSTYCTEQIDKKEMISLARISSYLNPEEPEEFSSMASEEFQVSAMISGVKSVLKNLIYVSYSGIYEGTLLNLGFDNKLICDKKVLFDEEKKSLTFTSIPESLIKQLEE